MNFQQKPDRVLNQNNSEELCGCTICEKGTIYADEEYFGCSNGDCTLAQGRRMMGRRKLALEEIIILIKEGKTPVFNDFISKRGNSFNAHLFLEEKIRSGTQRLVVSFEFAQEELPEYEVDNTPVYDDGEGLVVIETATHFEAQREQLKEFDIPRTIKERQLSREECASMLEKGQVGPLEGFISAKGKPFKATLYLDARKQVKFRFERRKKKKSRR